MGRYRVLIKPSAVKELEALPESHRELVVRRIHVLADNPRPPGCQKLSGEEKYRIRQGVYRILYEIREQEVIVVVVKIGHRRDVYR